MSPTARLTGETFAMAIDINVGAGVDVVDVVVVLTGVVFTVETDSVEQAPVNIVIIANNPRVKQYPINPDFFLFTLILRFSKAHHKRAIDILTQKPWKS